MAKEIVLTLAAALAPAAMLRAQADEGPSAFNNRIVLQATISPGYLFSEGLWNSYFHPSLAWCFGDRFSIRTDGAFFFSSQGGRQPLRMNHMSSLGAFCHFPRRSVDLYVGLQPAAAFVQMNPFTLGDSLEIEPPLRVEPLFTATAGADYFFSKYFNLFFAVKFVHGTHIPSLGTPLPLDELRLSGGLGWNMNIRRKRAEAAGP